MRRQGRVSDEENIGRKIFGYAFIVFVIIVLLGSFYIIPAGKRGVLLTFGKPSMESINEGLHIKMPLAQKVVRMDVRVLRFDAPKASSASRDLQIVTTDVTLNYKILAESVPELYQGIGLDYESKIIVPAVQEIVKASTAKYTAEELITKRPEAKDSIEIALRERLMKSGLIVTEISITNFEFSEEFNKAIEEKVTAQQQKIKAENDLERIKVEKEQVITQAEGQSEAQRLQKLQLTPELVTMRALQVQEQAIAKWDSRLPLVVGSGSIPFLGDLSSLTNTTR